MTVTTRSRGPQRSFPASGLFFVFILVILICSAGCLEPYPGGEGPAPLGTPAGTPEVTMTIPAVPTTVSVGRGISAEAPAAGYIERSYGYVPIAETPENSLTYIDATATKDASGMVTVTGRIRNDGPGSLNYLHVTYTLYDANGNILCNAHASVEYVGSGKTWRFTTEPVRAPAYQYFELARIVMQ